MKRWRRVFGLVVWMMALGLAGLGIAGPVKAGESGEGLRVGQAAPGFEARASDGKTYTLDGLKGKVVVLYFYPKDDTPGCTVQAKGFQGAGASFSAEGAIVLGVSRDDLESHKEFAAEYGLTFPLLLDPEGSLHDAYGAWKQGSIWGRTALGVNRSTIVIDRKGLVRKIWRSVDPDGHAEQVLAFVKSLARKSTSGAPSGAK